MASIPRKDLRFGLEQQINCLFVFHISILHTEQNKRIRAESADNGRLDDTAPIVLERRVSLNVFHFRWSLDDLKYEHNNETALLEASMFHYNLCDTV